MARANGRKPILLESLLKEDRRFAPPARFQEHAHIKTRSLYQEAEKDPEGFWARRAATELHWFRKWDSVLDWKSPWAKWFVGDSSTSRTTASTGTP